MKLPKFLSGTFLNTNIPNIALFGNVSEEQIIDLMLDASDATIEVALCCCAQGIDDFISAYYKVVMHNIRLIENGNFNFHFQFKKRIKLLKENIKRIALERKELLEEQNQKGGIVKNEKIQS